MKGASGTPRRNALRLVAGVPALWLAACGGASGAAKTGGAPAAALPPATIEYMHWAAAGGSQAVAREESAKKFMAKVPGVTVNVSAVAPSGTMLEKFKTTSAAGTPAD